MNISEVNGFVQKNQIAASKPNFLRRLTNLFVKTKEESLDKIPKEFSAFYAETDSEESVESVVTPQQEESGQIEKYVCESIFSGPESNVSDVATDEFSSCLFQGDDSL